MTTTTSLVPKVIDYLVAHATSALPSVLVVDGPQPPQVTQDREQVLWIGADPAALGDPAAEADQAFATALDHALLRDETASVLCAAQHWSGDTSNKVHRDGAAAVMATVELLLRGDGEGNGPGDATMGGLVFWSQVQPSQWFPRQVAKGASCLVTFRVTYYGRLTT